MTGQTGWMRKKQPRTLYVQGLQQEKITEELLKAAFITFGEIKSVSIPRDFDEDGAGADSSRNGQAIMRGYGFVEFELEEDMQAALDNMDGAELFGRTIHCANARPMKEHTDKAVWGGEPQQDVASG